MYMYVRLTCCARAEYTVEENEDDKGNTTQVKRAHTFINCDEFVKLQPAACDGTSKKRADPLSSERWCSVTPSQVSRAHVSNQLCRVFAFVSVPIDTPTLSPPQPYPCFAVSGRAGCNTSCHEGKEECQWAL